MEITNRVHRSLIALGVALVMLLPVSVSAQTAPVLSILSPSNGTVVPAGQSVQVVVSTTNTSLLSGEFIVSQSPIGTSNIQPASNQVIFNIQIPTSTAPGTYFVNAVGALIQGGITDHTAASSVALVVPVAGAVSAIAANLRTLTLDYAGEQLPIIITATTSQGSFTIPDEQLLFTSKNLNIASVASNGVVTGQAPGQTQITVSYASGSSSLSTTVNVQVLGKVQGDLNGDGKVDSDDLTILDSYLNTQANGANDARDLNHDGVINALDARILTTLCTYPRCATHQ
jgi:hypothetical protein